MNSNPLNHNEPMIWKDVATVALILTVATYFTLFLPSWNAVSIEEQLVEFVFGSLQFLGAGFFTQFIALAGLHKLTEKKT